ncbi:serine/threonine protein kinase [Nonomuraea sp. K274]|uniref:Serine/threonine protein kinase n=1 Tax=Nonomuraea cypriaca TaxID=1187855 RepID=A0A931A633_9ACTN|nr:serine/threonine-protein kinase [Nonomuraea cypriaca]MBF8187017.1 serine/threonine protein kinase [Nonomuraea cypriaca]
MPPVPLEPGDPRMLGAFQILGRLGEGGQGIVYEGRSTSGDRVAIKVLKGGTDPDTRRRLARELDSARRVAPFCTARVLGADLDRPAPYVVSEFVAGPSLQERVRGGGPLRDGDLERLAVGTASALAAIHGAGVVHRDFKPANVLLGPDGPRVVDFGIARPLDAGTAPSALSGTPPYMAPEQLKGEHGSPAADVFGWAATMVYAATGRAPFGSDTVAAVFNRILNQDPDLSGVPESLRETLATCLSKDPGTRPSARSLLIRLVDPGASTVTVPDVGPVPTAYLPPDWPGPGPARPPAAPRTVPLDGDTRRAKRHAIPLIAISVAVIAAAGALYATGRIGGSAADDGTTSQVEPSTSADQDPASASTPTPPPARTRVIPEAFAGTWTGQVVSDDTHKETATVTIALSQGQSTGTWAKDDCTQQVTLTRVRNGPALELTLVQQDQCVGGDMTLTLEDSATLHLVGQEGAGSLTYQGSLRRS